MDIDSMSSGRSMDALIAEKIMGLEKIEPVFGSPETDWNGWKNAKGDVLSHLDHYSTDIAAAWQVVQRFENRILMSQENNGWWVEILDNDGNFIEGAYSEYGDSTPSLAICRAALKATW